MPYLVKIIILQGNNYIQEWIRKANVVELMGHSCSCMLHHTSSSKVAFSAIWD